MEFKIKYEFPDVVLSNGNKYTLVGYGSTEAEAKENVTKDLLELIEKFK